VTCPTAQLEPGSMTLLADDLPDLDLLCGDGFVLVSFDVGFPEARPVVRSRALADGVFDDSTYLGQRALTATIRLDHRHGETTQELIDKLMPFMSPRRRPTVRWSLSGSPLDFREVRVRGVDAPLVIDAPKYPILVLQWVTEGAFLTDPVEQCQTVDPSDLPEELGREYDLEFDREYESITPVGGMFVDNAGNAPAHWVITLFASMIDPVVTINNRQMNFSQGGGLALVTGQTLVIDSLARTILLNGDPNESRYDRVNFEDWNWDDLLLQPGQNLVRLQGSGFSQFAALTICWKDTYL
jgi:hypothetical protein